MADGFAGLPQPGMNPGGTNVPVATPATAPTPAIGGTSNPFIPGYPSGQSTFPANYNPSAAPPQGGSSSTAGTSAPTSALIPGGGKGEKPAQISNELQKMGIPKGIAEMIGGFLHSGAGFNPDVANALIAAMQPGVNRGEADILEQFSNMGLRGGSPAAIGLGDYLSQVQLNEGQIFAQLYEQSVQNYMSVLMGAGEWGNQQQQVKMQQPSMFDQIMGGIGSLLGGTGDLLTGIGGL